MRATRKDRGEQFTLAGLARRLFVGELKLTDFRNYVSAKLELDERPVVLVGDNGSGKTNLLEAVSLLTSGHGLRTRPYAEL
ncbi:MAG: AAA family ATPase, partial [Methyloceanibacter sp.]